MFSKLFYSTSTNNKIEYFTTWDQNLYFINNMVSKKKNPDIKVSKQNRNKL